MASTNKTSNLELSQFIATDTPTWLVDYNGDMEKIDAGVGRVEELANTASTQAVGVASGLQATNQTVTTLSGQVANVQNQANTTTASVNGINQRLGNTDISGVGDGTVTGAINALNSGGSGTGVIKTISKSYTIPANQTQVNVGSLNTDFAEAKNGTILGFITDARNSPTNVYVDNNGYVLVMESTGNAQTVAVTGTLTLLYI